jgi:hypothetical protein
LVGDSAASLIDGSTALVLVGDSVNGTASIHAAMVGMRLRQHWWTNTEGKKAQAW